MKESDARRVGCPAQKQEAREFFVMFVFPFVSTEVCGKEMGTRDEENGPVSRSIWGWEEGFIVFIYTPVLTVS